MDWITLILPLVLSWPVVALVILLILRRPLLSLLSRFGTGAGSEAELGPLKIKLGGLARDGETAVGRLNRISELMAESRLLELEITSSTFGSMFTDEQQRRMATQMEELRRLTSSTAPQSASTGIPTSASSRHRRG
jgi:hypothetical protein